MISKEKLEEFLELGNGSPSFLLHILSTYLLNFKKLLRLCWRHFEKNDREALAFEIHTLKGSSANLGLDSISEFLSELEAKLNEVSREELKTSLEKLESYLTIVDDYQRSFTSMPTNA